MQPRPIWIMFNEDGVKRPVCEDPDCHPDVIHTHVLNDLEQADT